MKKIKIISIAVMVSLVMFGSNASAQLSMLTGFAKGSYHSLGKDMKKMCGKLITVDTIKQTRVVENDYGDVIDEKDTTIIETQESVFLTLTPSGGSRDNFRQLVNPHSGIDVSFMQYDVLLYEQLKQMKARVNKVDSLRILLPLGFEEIHLITRNYSYIRRLKDLKNEYVAIGNTQQGTYVTSSFIKEITGGEWQDVTYNMETAFKALLKNTISAFFFVGSAPVSKFESLASLLKYEIRLVPIENDNLDVYYQKVIIRGGTYKWEKEDIPTYAVKYALVTNVTGETEKKIESLRKLLTDIKDNLTVLQETGHPAWEQVDLDFEGIDWEVHDIAKEVFEIE